MSHKPKPIVVPAQAGQRLARFTAIIHTKKGRPTGVELEIELIVAWQLRRINVFGEDDYAVQPITLAGIADKEQVAVWVADDLWTVGGSEMLSLEECEAKFLAEIQGDWDAAQPAPVYNVDRHGTCRAG